MLLVRVTAAIMIQDGQLFIAKRAENGSMAGLWEFPGGKIEQGETPEDCLRREMQEEFGIEVEVLHHCHTSIYNYADKTIELISYFVNWVSGEMQLTSHSEVCFVAVADVLAYDFAPADVPIAEYIMRQHLGK
ncbi:MAG: 8-oxo-dGTP diphosphatase MutT [bacterium]|nr:8-oxo-dGTP diphosphatase MutT [bacterium]